MITWIILHHTGGTDANPLEDTSHHTFDVVNDYHRKIFNFKSSLGFYIGYQYFIERNGVIKQGRRDLEEGAHTIGRNKDSIGICLAGNFDLTLPTEAQVEALRELLKNLMTRYEVPITNIVPHRTFAKKSCYGVNLSDEWGRQLVYQKISGQCVKAEDIEKLAKKYESRSFTRKIIRLLKKI